MTDRPKFGKEVLARRNAKKWSRSALAEKLTSETGGKLRCSTTRIYRLETEDEVPENLLKAIESVLEFGELTRATVDRDYATPRWTWIEPNSDDPFEAVQLEVEKAEVHLKKAAELTEELFGQMGPDDFFAATTTTLLPVVLEDIGGPFWQKRSEAIRKGTLSVMIVPCEPLWRDCLDRRYGFGVHSNPTLVDAHDRFRVSLRDRAGMAERYIDRHVGVFEWGEFPLTPAFMTVSLFGRRRGGPEPFMRVVSRGLFRDRTALHLWPHKEGDAQIEHRLRDFIRVVLKAHREAAANGAPLPWEVTGSKPPERRKVGWPPAADDRLWLIDCLENRLHNLGDPLDDGTV